MKHNIGKLFLICLILSCLSLYIIPPVSGTVWADEIKDPETVQDIPTENMEVPDSPHDQTESAAEFPEDGIGRTWRGFGSGSGRGSGWGRIRIIRVADGIGNGKYAWRGIRGGSHSFGR